MVLNLNKLKEYNDQKFKEDLKAMENYKYITNMTNKLTWEEEWDDLCEPKHCPDPGCWDCDSKAEQHFRQKEFISTKLAEQRREIVEKILKIPCKWEEDEHEYLMEEIANLIKQ